MTTPQLLAFAILAGMMALFIWGRIRYDMVAVLALLVSLLVGIVPADKAFSGFADDIVIIVASALVISAAVARSGIIEAALVRATGGFSRMGSQLIVLVGSVTLLSGFVKNIGALAMLMPAAFQMAKRSRVSPSCLLMPMSFGSLLGGLVTLVGTSPNIIVSRVREEMTGRPFEMFDYAPVGLGLSLAGLLFLRWGYKLLPTNRRAAPTMGEALNITDYTTEARIPPHSPADGVTIAAFKQLTDGEVEVTGLHRGERRRIMPLPDASLHGGDVLMLEGEPEALERAIAAAGLQLEGQHRDAVTEAGGSDIGVIEAVIGKGSILVGQGAGRMELHDRHGVNLIAVSRSGERLTQRLRDIHLCPGDVIVLQGPLSTLPARLRELGCLPLAERGLRLGSARKGLIPIAILGGAMALTAVGWVPVAVAFFAAAALIMLTGGLPAREAYSRIEWPILVMIACLIPVSDSLRTTGATDLIAGWLSTTAATLPAWAAVGLIMVAAMAVTPFLNNAATVLVMAPIASVFATQLGYKPEAFLMAVAVGAGSDFLTPIGHQCNTLVMGPGGYRFGDYARLGAPLSLLVIAVGVPLILATWPLR
nr:SLC13 family permease [uncultured Sphingosinicella sp.]